MRWIYQKCRKCILSTLLNRVEYYYPGQILDPAAPPPECWNCSHATACLPWVATHGGAVNISIDSHEHIHVRVHWGHDYEQNCCQFQKNGVLGAAPQSLWGTWHCPCSPLSSLWLSSVVVSDLRYSTPRRGGSQHLALKVCLYDCAPIASVLHIVLLLTLAKRDSSRSLQVPAILFGGMIKLLEHFRIFRIQTLLL